MFGARYVQNGQLYRSLLFGRCLYAWYGERAYDPLERLVGNGATSPLLTNLLTGERFFAKRFDGDEYELAKYRSCVLYPIFKSMGSWPCDIIELNDAQAPDYRLFVRHEYTDVPTPVDRWPGRYALLFPLGELSALESAEERLRRTNVKDGWKSGDIRDMAVKITEAVININKAGYIFADMHFSRFFFSGDSCYLGFSNLTFPLSDLDDPQAKCTRAPKRGEYPLEFAEPAYAQGKVDAMDMRTQNFSLTALLFYLLLGRYAYDGNMTEHITDNNMINHYNLLDYFLETPVFIFDPQNRDNELGANIQRNRETLSLWHDLPFDLQQFFYLGLNTESALRETRNIPTPNAWMRRFEGLGWTHGK